MPVMTVGDLREVLKTQYKDDDVIVVNWWGFEDVVNNLNDIFYDSDFEVTKEEATELWEKINHEVDYVLDDQSEAVYDAIAELVNREA